MTDDLTLDASKSRKKKGGLGGLERPREVREGIISQGPQVRQAPLIQDPRFEIIRNNKREAGGVGLGTSRGAPRGLLDCLGLVAADPTRRLSFPKRVAVCVYVSTHYGRAYAAACCCVIDCGEKMGKTAGFGGSQSWEGVQAACALGFGLAALVL